MPITIMQPLYQPPRPPTGGGGVTMDVPLPGVTIAHVDGCACPVCLGLKCLERPRYFAGQLLTEAELNGEQAYALAKQRLHNRYLHGWGIVCGLEVVCSDCDGFVTINPGYALDPCGNDIIACAPQQFDVIKAIRECCDASRRRRKTDCDPYEPIPATSCTDVEQTWCITIEYEEKEARPTTPLRPDKKKSCSCGCGTSGASSGCGCGCHGSSRAAKSCSAPAKPDLGMKTMGACEPTRTLEGFRICVVEEPDGCCHDLNIAGDRKSQGGTLGWLTSLVPQNTLLGRLIGCIKSAIEFLRKRLSPTELQLVSTVAAGSGNPNVSPEDLHKALCRLRQAVIDLYMDDPHNVRCQLLHVLDQVTCPAPESDQKIDSYTNAVRPQAQHLFALIFEYMRECICMAFIPACSHDPTDPRVRLACVTVKKNKILRICNLSCRRYAGAFPTWSYWMSIVPLGPLISTILCNICCGPDLVHADSPLVNELMKFIERIDPDGSMRQMVVGDNFAVPKRKVAQLETAAARFTLAGLRERIAAAPGAVALNRLVGSTRSDVMSTLKDAGVQAVFRDATSRDDPRVKSAAPASIAMRDEQVVVYTADDKVVGFGRYTTEERLADKDAELEKLREDLESLKREVRDLGRG